MRSRKLKFCVLHLMHVLNQTLWVMTPISKWIYVLTWSQEVILSLYWCIVCTIYNAPFTGAVVGSSCHILLLQWKEGKCRWAKWLKPMIKFFEVSNLGGLIKFFSLQPIFMKLLEFILPISCRNAGFHQACSFSHQYNFLLNV